MSPRGIKTVAIVLICLMYAAFAATLVVASMRETDGRAVPVPTTVPMPSDFSTNPPMPLCVVEKNCSINGSLEYKG